MKINDIYEVKIIDVNSIGNGIAKIDNMVIFIKNALKDELVKIKIIKTEKNYAIGELLEIIEKSKDRISSICPYYDKCGGCSFLHTKYENEINIKVNTLEHLFNRKVNNLDVKNYLNYRNKITLKVIDGKIGYFNDETHDLCEIDKCLLVNDKINEIINKLKDIDLNNLYQIMVRSVSNQTMVVFYTNNENYNYIFKDCDSFYINNKHIYGKEYLIDEINNLKFTIYPESFYQVNREGMEKIYNKALDYAGKYSSLLDLYCGTGTIGIWMNNNFYNITGIEIVKSSIKNANINKELNNLKNIKFICGDAKIAKGNYDVIVVDPPRSGLSKDVINYLNNSNCKKLVYISCNPFSLKNNINNLISYKLIDVSCANMFPRTKHVESITLLERKHFFLFH